MHRVGRTSRAGQKGWSYSLVSESDLPYLLDLQLFLGKRLLLGHDQAKDSNYAEDVVIGRLERDLLDRSCESVSKLLDEDSDLSMLRSVASKGEKLYLKTRNSASAESVRRAKEMARSKDWAGMHPLFNNRSGGAEVERENMLARVSKFRPQETVFEIGNRGGTGEAAEVMRRRRAAVDARKQKRQENKNETPDSATHYGDENDDIVVGTHGDLATDHSDKETVSESELEVTFNQPTSSKERKSNGHWKDSDFFMSYTPSATNLAEDRAYGVQSGSYNTAQGSDFLVAAKGATMDLNNDEGTKAFGEPSQPRGMRWDKKSKKYVAKANDVDGSKGAKMIRGESGHKIAASFRSGRFDSWRKANRVARLPRIGEAEKRENASMTGSGARYKHKAEKAPKPADKFRDDYYKRKKMVEAAKERNIGRLKDNRRGSKEVKGVDDVRRVRGLKERRKAKNARPSKWKK